MAAGHLTSRQAELARKVPVAEDITAEADSGGHTVDNQFVFGGGFPYLKGASNYVASPQTLPFKGNLAPQGDQGWLTWELLRLASADLIPAAMLNNERLGQPLNAADLKPAVEALAKRLNLAPSLRPMEQGSRLFLWMARSLGLDQVIEGMERPQDALYFLGETTLKPEDRLLAAFLVRRILVGPGAWKGQAPTLGQGLQALARMWQELEPLELGDGTLLRDGQVRVKNSGPSPLMLASPILLAEEAPGGSLRLVGESAIQVGDRVKWIPREGGSRLLVRRMDLDGAALDRYNPAAHWKVELKEAELLDKLKQKGGIRGFGGFELVHNEHGRVTELIVRDAEGRSHRFTGMRIRGLLGLKDNVFRFIQVGEKPFRRWIFFGRG